MRERGGVWIAHGDGSADRAVVDGGDKVRVPPDRPSYDAAAPVGRSGAVQLVLRRLRERGAVAALPSRRRASAVPDRGLGGLSGGERDGSPPLSTRSWRTAETPVFIQDYHLALVASDLRARRPDARTALFWHIPWPYPDRLRICPWRREILAGLLANDLLAFQLDRDRRNFLLAVEEELDAEVGADGERIRYGGRFCTVTSVPIGVDYDRIQGVIADPALPVEQRRLQRDVRPASTGDRPRSRSARLHERDSRTARSPGCVCSRSGRICAAG